jgi:prevent-host-death family protein
MRGTAKRVGHGVGKVWQLAQAKSRLGEVVDEAAKHGPQVIRRRGVEAAVVLSFDDYVRLAKPQGSLVEFLSSSPLTGSGLDVERSKDPGRPVDL